MGSIYSRSLDSITGRKLLQSQHDRILAKDTGQGSALRSDERAKNARPCPGSLSAHVCVPLWKKCD